MSGLLALLDDVAAIAKLAATNLDDITSMAAKAGSKTAGVVIDDAAVTPKYVHGLAPKRELPIIWKIAKASFFNKLIILLPIAILLDVYIPWLITPLLMLGGLYLCFEGAEKIYHLLRPHENEIVEADLTVKDPAHLKESRVRGAIKTDFILSAEIMTISLSAIPDGNIWQSAGALAIIAIVITAAVYGVVGLIVKMDDIGLTLSTEKRHGILKAIGRTLVKAMPYVMLVLSVVGTAAMLWVGGSILTHGAHELGWHFPYDSIKHIATLIAQTGALNWLSTAFFDGIIGLSAGLLLIPIVTAVSRSYA
ncbi:DUF808 domain-containing protein [Ostreibacterium oceani]|uniref:DUF808 family protein n=1 Tax=Ostreibacterium oceani TaxID=2654998 RepID=A0A6N7F438_9GAMM|nr:DUF808 domain-containing protein [Ostreibacterium oceani]MPV86646.1 DUF808 family protein [Ostreibacterium oceani]